MGDVSSSSSVFLENTLHQKLHNSEFYFADKQPGIPFMISPGRRLCGVASPDWGTAVVQIPWDIYLYLRQQGSARNLLRRNETMGRSHRGADRERHRSLRSGRLVSAERKRGDRLPDPGQLDSVPLSRRGTWFRKRRPYSAKRKTRRIMPPCATGSARLSSINSTTKRTKRSAARPQTRWRWLTAWCRPATKKRFPTPPSAT